MGITKNWWKVAIGVGLALLVVRALELRLPGITAHMNEDEIHHNYWLLEYNSAFGDYIVWQLQPLLAYHLLLYFWFPFLSLSPQTWLIVALLAAPLIAGAIWLRRLARTVSKRNHQKSIWKLYFAISSLAVLVGLAILWQRLAISSGAAILGLSARSLIIVGLNIMLLAFFAYFSFLAWFTTTGFDRFSDKLREQSVQRSVSFASIVTFAVIGGGLLSWQYGIVPISAGLDIYLRRLAPLLIEISILALLTATACELARGNRRIWLAFICILAGLFLAFALKPLAQHANYTELTLKTPSLFFSLATVAIGFTLFRKYLVTKGYPPLAVLVLAILATLWIVYHPLDIQMSMTARHYSFVILSSVLWFWHFIVYGKTNSAAFWLISLLFLNAHFFAILVVLAGYGFGSARSFFQRDVRGGLQTAGLGLGVVLAALAINFPVAYYILAIGSNASLPQFIENISNGMFAIWNYVKVLNFPKPELFIGNNESVFGVVESLGGLLLFLIAILIALPLKDQIQKRFAFIGVSLLPILVYYGSRPDYSFAERYYTPFLGFGFVVVALALERAFLFVRDARKTGVNRLRAIDLAVFLVVVPFVLLTASDFAIGLVRDAQQLRIPPPSDSPFSHIYSELKDESNKMLVFFYSPIAVRRDIPNFYLDHVDGGYEGRYELLNASTSPSLAREKTEFFIQSYANNIIVFDGLIGGCGQQFLTQGDWNATVTRLATPSCVWVITELSSYEEMCEIARALDFPPEEGQNLCNEG